MLEIAAAELVGHHRGLHHRRIEDVAADDDEARLGHQRVLVGADHPAVVGENGTFSWFSPMVLPVTVSASRVEAPGLDQLLDHRRHAAGAVELLAQILAGRLHVDQERDVVAHLPVLDVELDAHVARDRDHVRRAVGRGAGGGRGEDRVLERLAGQDLGRASGPPRPSRPRACRWRRPSGRARGRGRGWRHSR